MQLRRILPTRGLTLVALAAVAVVLAVSWPTGRDGASADNVVDVMSLSANGPNVECDGNPSIDKGDVLKPDKCTMPVGDSFTLSVEVNKLPTSGGYMGFGTQIDYGSLVYKPQTGVPPDAPGAIEVVWPDAYAPQPLKAESLSVRFPMFPTGLEGKVEHASLTGNSPPFPTSTWTGNVVEITLNCTVPGANLVDLVPYEEPDNLTGTVLRDSTSPEPIPASDSLTINCVSDDSDGDGCLDAAEQQPKANASTGGGRDPFWYWDFYDVNHDGTVGMFDDILDVAGRFGATHSVPYDKAEARVDAKVLPVPPAGTYYAAADRSPGPGPNAWNIGGPDGTIGMFDDILAVAAQFGHTC